MVDERTEHRVICDGCGQELDAVQRSISPIKMGIPGGNSIPGGV